MRADVTIQILTADDAGLLDNVHDDVFDEPVRPDRLTAYLRQSNHILMVAVDSDLVVAQVAAVVHRHPDKATELYIDEVAVAQPWQGRGLATEMLKRMFSHGKLLGCEEAWVGTEVDNVPARKLYEAFKGKPAEFFVMHVYEL